MELPTRPPTGLLLRDSIKGERSRHWPQRLSTFSNRRGRRGVSVPAAVDLQAAHNADTRVWAAFEEPDDNFRSPTRREQPMPMIPEVDDAAYWRDSDLKRWVAGQAPTIEDDQPTQSFPNQPAPTSAPIPQAFNEPPTRSSSPIGLGITLPSGVHFVTPTYPTYSESTTGGSATPTYTQRITSSAISSIFNAYTDAARGPGKASRDNEASQPYQSDLPSASSTASSAVDLEKQAANAPAYPATGANPIPIAKPRTLNEVEKMNIRGGFPSPGAPSSTGIPTTAPRSAVEITARSKAWQLRLHRRHRRRVVIISLSVLALVTMLSGVIAALATAGKKDIEKSNAAAETGVGRTVM